MLTVPRAGRMLLTEFVVTREGTVHERLPEDVPCPRLLIFGLEGELFFGASSALERHFAEIEGRIDERTQVVILRLKRAHNPDAVALKLLEAFLERMKQRGVHVLMGGVRAHLYEVLVRTGVAARLGERIFREQPVRQTSTMLAIRHAYRLMDELCPDCPRRDPAAREQELTYEV
jgi:SulP family sulfate permease